MADLRIEACSSLPTPYGSFSLLGFTWQGEEHVALTMGNLEGEPPLVRVHSECLTGEVFGSLRCDCAAQLHDALERIGSAGRGVLVYLRQEGRGIGLFNKIKAYHLQDHGKDTVEANQALGFTEDLRDYRPAAHVLKSLGIERLLLMTNNPRKVAALEQQGLSVRRVPLESGHHSENNGYLRTKRDKLGHLLSL